MACLNRCNVFAWRSSGPPWCVSTGVKFSRWPNRPIHLFIYLFYFCLKKDGLKTALVCLSPGQPAPSPSWCQTYCTVLLYCAVCICSLQINIGVGIYFNSCNPMVYSVSQFSLFPVHTRHNSTIVPSSLYTPLCFVYNQKRLSLGGRGLY